MKGDKMTSVSIRALLGVGHILAFRPMIMKKNCHGSVEVHRKTFICTPVHLPAPHLLNN